MLCYRVGHPNLLFLPAPLIAFGFGGLFTTVAAMIADVCDQDELANGQRREATFGRDLLVDDEAGNGFGSGDFRLFVELDRL